MDSTSSDPNQPPTVSSNDLFEVDAKNRIAFAGIWLIVLGCLDLVVVALFAREIPFGVILWSALILVLFGILVAARFRAALVAVRLLGAIAIVILIIVSLILFVDVSSGTVTDPPPWQIALVILLIAGTLIPPWWSVQHTLKVTPNTKTAGPLFLEIAQTFYFLIWVHFFVFVSFLIYCRLSSLHLDHGLYLVYGFGSTLLLLWVTSIVFSLVAWRWRLVLASLFTPLILYGWLWFLR